MPSPLARRPLDPELAHDASYFAASARIASFSRTSTPPPPRCVQLTEDKPQCPPWGVGSGGEERSVGGGFRQGLGPPTGDPIVEPHCVGELGGESDRLVGHGMQAEQLE